MTNEEGSDQSELPVEDLSIRIVLEDISLELADLNANLVDEDWQWETMTRRTAERIYAGIILAQAIHGGGSAPTLTMQWELAAQAWQLANMLVAYGQGTMAKKEVDQQILSGSDTPPADRPPAA